MFGEHRTLRNLQLKRSISQESIETAKAVSVQKLFTGQLKRMGKVLMGNCPFHKDDTPSFAIYPSTNTYHCFSCNKSGDTISLYMNLHNCSFAEAVRELVK